MKTALLLAIILISFYSTGQQTIKIYHGVKGSTEIYEKNGIGVMKAIKAKKGEKVSIEISNPHPALYQYNFKTEIIKEDIEHIEGTSNLISLLSVLLSQEPSDFAKQSPGSTGRVAAISVINSWQSNYLKKIQSLKDDIVSAKSIIDNSDIPESLTEVIDKKYNTGFQYAKNELSKKAFFKNKNLEKDIEQWKSDFEKAADYDDTDPEQVLIMEIYNNYSQSLLKLAQDIKVEYSENISNKISFTITVGDSIQDIYLNIKNKSEDVKRREVGDKIITIRIEPLYQHAVLEFVPVAAMIYSKHSLKYSVKDNVIVQEQDDKFKFRPGGILNLNLTNWGAVNQFALGIGAGFAISDNKLNTFFGSLLFSYKKYCRFGLGIGAMDEPSYLKSGIVGQPLPSDVNGINDIVGYKMQPAIFFTFVIPGLTLSLLN
jgi:hypothetical protein